MHVPTHLLTGRLFTTAGDFLLIQYEAGSKVIVHEAVALHPEPAATIQKAPRINNSQPEVTNN